jgi:Ras family protein T1
VVTCAQFCEKFVWLQWAFMTFIDPAWSVENMIYVGYPGNPLSAFRETGKRHLDRKKQQIGRNVFQCFVFGPRRLESLPC